MPEIDYKRLLNVMDPPEAIEITVEARLDRQIYVNLNSPVMVEKKMVEEAMCREIAKALIEKKLVEFRYVDSPMYDCITVHGKVKIFERNYKLKILI